MYTVTCMLQVAKTFEDIPAKHVAQLVEQLLAAYGPTTITIQPADSRQVEPAAEPRVFEVDREAFLKP